MRLTRLPLVLEWFTSGLWRRAREQRNSDLAWCIDAPRTGPLGWSTRTMSWRGWIRAARADAQPVEIYVRRPKRRGYGGMLTEPDATGAQAFTIDYIGSSGLKLYRLCLRWSDGRETLLGCRLFWCRRQVRHVPPRLVLQTKVPSPAEIDLPAESAPEVSILIPVFNQTELTLKCLQALARHTGDVRYEVILIDDASTEAAAAALADVRHLHLLRNATNRGFLANCNRAAGVARGRYLVFLNNDTEVQPGWLAALLQTYRLRRDTGLVGARLVHPDGRLQEAGGIVWSDGSAANYGKNRHPFEPAFSYLKPVDYCSGACLAIERELFWSLGGFDGRYSPAYYEDTDLAFRVRAAGLEVYYQPQSVVVHHEGATAGTDPAVGVKRHQVLNAATFRARWEDTLRCTQRPPNRDWFLARDRSAGRACIAIVDHKVPHFDRDAGSRAMLQYIELFLAHGANVKFITDHADSDPRYARHLEALGVETIWGPAVPRTAIRGWFREHGRHLDHVLLSRPQVAERYLPIVRRHTRAQVSYLGHDIHFLREQGEARFSPTAEKNWRRTRRRELNLWQRADVIYSFTSEESEYIARTVPGSVTRTIPLFLDHGDSEMAEAPDNETRGLLFVGGYEHKPNRDALQWLFTDILPRVHARVPELELHVCGSGIPPEVRQRAPAGVRFHIDISDAQLRALYRHTRVCVVPLRFGAGLKGKVVEALFHRKPIVTTPVGAQGLPELATFAAVADEASAFAEHVVRLCCDPAARHLARAGAAELVGARFSPSQALEVLSQDFGFLRPDRRSQHSMSAPTRTEPGSTAEPRPASALAE